MRLSVGGRLALVSLGVVVLVAGVLAALLSVQLSDSGQREAAQVTRSVAETFAHEAEIATLAAARDSDRLQPMVEQILPDADLSFVTIMTPDGTRLTHRNRSEIGLPYQGSRAEALAGESFTEVYVGTLGPSVRTIVPIREGGDEAGPIVGLVAVGVTLGAVQQDLAARVPLIVAASAAIVGFGVLGALFVRRSARRVTGSYTPRELARLVESYETVLHSLREGLVVTDRDGRIVLYNDEAADLLGLPPAITGQVSLDPHDVDMDADLADAIAGGRRLVEETIVNGDRVLLVNQEEARDLAGRRAPERGRVMTLRDRSELQALLGELEGVRTLSDTLRSQTHEHGNRLHALLALLELGRIDEARRLIVASTEDRQELADRLVSDDDDAVIVALLLGKLDEAAERGVRLDLHVAEPAPHVPLAAPEAVTVVGNLVDNALDAAAAGADPRWVRVSLAEREGDAVLEVSDSGAGFDPALRDPFAYGASTKPAHMPGGRGVGLALVRDIVAARGGTLQLAAEPTTVRVFLPVVSDQVPA
ncbi:two-component system CitB family sensor kinase [Microbacterium proteolyticum]|uniref:Sensor-like histidine kinase SenX3 n=1 Tax=Microbacterium proteolyticum TaxID=1572644 RepID=A0A7W5CKJ7_9MICO|nr:ATP-binding protein [Microbacterium proteolyticum]MBB3159332.1 two-component system CitB family sensor kinase [Microbacterium proteolyticum]